MSSKRRRSSGGAHSLLPISKKVRTKHLSDHLSELSDELLIRILHNLPIQSLLICQRLSHRFYTLAADSQIWKNLYYNQFVLPRALRIPGIKAAQAEDVLHFSSRRSKWLNDDTLVNRTDGKTTNWKGQYKLRHNWSIGACEVQEIHVADHPSIPSMLVKLAEGVIITADKEEGLRAWNLKEKALIAEYGLGRDTVPTCLAVDEQDSANGLGIVVGFMDGGWGTWTLDVAEKKFTPSYRHPASTNGMLSAVAYAKPYVLTITDAQLLSLYTFSSRPTIPAVDDNFVAEVEEIQTQGISENIFSEEEDAPTKSSSEHSPSEQQPTLIASLKSHTSWPPLSLSIRTTSKTLIASIAYSLPTYLSGYTVGLQELHLSLRTGLITFSRLASALPNGFTSLSPSSSSPPTSSPPGASIPMRGERGSTRPTTLSYSHPYILATHPDNTLTLYLCQSTPTSLSLSPGTKLWGHTSSVSSAQITPRGKAVSVSTRGNELRVWELEGGSGFRKRLSTAAKSSKGLERSVRIRPETKGRHDSHGDETDCEPGAEDVWRDGTGESDEARKRWVGFDDEVVIVLKESGKGTQALMVYDFT